MAKDVTKFPTYHLGESCRTDQAPGPLPYFFISNPVDATLSAIDDTIYIYCQGFN